MLTLRTLGLEHFYRSYGDRGDQTKVHEEEDFLDGQLEIDPSLLSVPVILEVSVVSDAESKAKERIHPNLLHVGTCHGMDSPSWRIKLEIKDGNIFWINETLRNTVEDFQQQTLKRICKLHPNPQYPSINNILDIKDLCLSIVTPSTNELKSSQREIKDCIRLRRGTKRTSECHIESEEPRNGWNMSNFHNGSTNGLSNVQSNQDDSDRAKMNDMLTTSGLSELIHIFENEAITLDDLPDLTDAELKNIGIIKLGHRKKILRTARHLLSSGTYHRQTSPNSWEFSSETFSTPRSDSSLTPRSDSSSTPRSNQWDITPSPMSISSSSRSQSSRSEDRDCEDFRYKPRYQGVPKSTGSRKTPKNRLKFETEEDMETSAGTETD